eukprot:scaffold44594_cov21-Tisochrysis_lutea.AAC.1
MPMVQNARKRTEGQHLTAYPKNSQIKKGQRMDNPQHFYLAMQPRHSEAGKTVQRFLGQPALHSGKLDADSAHSGNQNHTMENKFKFQNPPSFAFDEAIQSLGSCTRKDKAKAQALKLPALGI